MKIDRLIGILSILLQQEKVTAPYLAEKFEVSRRTINRDVEDLCKAGIPLVTEQGANGGIAIMEGYKLNNTLLTSADMQAILAGLRSLDSVSGTKRYQQLMDKLAVNPGNTLPSNAHILIDLSSYYKESLAPKISLLQCAIENSSLVEFCYFAPNGESQRRIEPYLLVFQWSSWYIWGYCVEKCDFRLFKLNRLQHLKLCEESFVKRQMPPVNDVRQNQFQANIQVKARFFPQMKWRLIEEYGPDSFTEEPDGSLLFQFDFYQEENLIRWILSFGNQVELLEPRAYRQRVARLVGEIGNIYEENKAPAAESI